MSGKGVFDRTSDRDRDRPSRERDRAEREALACAWLRPECRYRDSDRNTASFRLAYMTRPHNTTNQNADRIVPPSTRIVAPLMYSA
jgi:hypothetical protein